MKKDDTVYLHHILDAVGLIEEYTNVWDTVKNDLPLLKKAFKKIL